VSAAPSPAFVAGATGYVGHALVRLLAERGARVAAHVRPDSARLGQWRERLAALGPGVEIDTTPWDEPAMTATLAARRPAAIFALLGTTRARMSAARGVDVGYEAVDYGLTALLRRAAEGAARETGVVPRFVYLSSVGVTPGTRNAYLRARARVEAELREGTLPYTIARPGVITGPDREESRPLERVASVVVDAALALPGLLGAHRLRDRYRTTSADELARALARLAADPRMEGATVEGDGLRD
jgi:nucleoside-diphosphate-sugar epimerase